jgi:hypothetical protein
MKESKRMMDAEIAFMKKKGAPKKMIKHEMDEKKSMGYAGGGMVMRGTGCAQRGKKFSRAG